MAHQPAVALFFTAQELFDLQLRQNTARIRRHDPRYGLDGIRGLQAPAAGQHDQSHGLALIVVDGFADIPLRLEFAQVHVVGKKFLDVLLVTLMVICDDMFAGRTRQHIDVAGGQNSSVQAAGNDTDALPFRFEQTDVHVIDPEIRCNEHDDLVQRVAAALTRHEIRHRNERVVGDIEIDRNIQRIRHSHSSCHTRLYNYYGTNRIR